MDKAEIRKIIDQCHEETKVIYNARGNFFDPKLKSINHLQVGKSEIISSPVTLFLEEMYQMYKDLRDQFSAFIKKQFPRRTVIFGHFENDVLTGKIMFERREKTYENGKPVFNEVPIRMMRVELWAQSRFFQWRKLGDDFTNNKGVFKMPFDLRAARTWTNRKNVRLEIYQTTHRINNRDEIVAEFERIKTIFIPKSEFIGCGYNVRTIYLPYWEYRRDSPVPRAYFPDNNKKAPEKYAQGRIDTISQQIIPIELTKRKHLMQIKDDPASITLQQIQRDYPKNLTVAIEEKLPGYTRSDEWFGERMMNGMNMATFLQDKNNPAHYWAKYFGACNYEVNNDYGFPTAEIKFRLTEEGLPMPLEIHLTGPLNAYNRDPYQKHVFTPADGDKWMQAKRIARVTSALCAELDQHLTGTHLNTEQFSIAVRRNMRRNPIGALLIPHTKAVVLINNTADDILINGYIADATAMTPKGCGMRARDLLGFQDWKGWKPMQPLSDAHRYAKLENLFYGIVSEFVDHFIDENKEDIIKHWGAIFRFSKDLTKHSVPLYHSTVDLSKMSEEERNFTQRRMEYLTEEFRLDLTQPRVTIDGELKVLSPVTTNEQYNPNHPEDMQNLRDISKYIIMTATFIHTWVNKHQYDDIGEVLYSCLGLRFGEEEHGILSSEANLNIAPSLTHSTQMMWFSNLLSRTGYGFITNNEENDIDPHFVEMLQNNKAAFEELGFDITQVASRTNI